jgi:hypothetical protein
MFPVRGLGADLDQIVNKLCPVFPTFAQRPPIDVCPSVLWSNPECQENIDDNG